MRSRLTCPLKPVCLLRSAYEGKTESSKEKPVPVPGELTGENMPFTIGIQTPWQKKMMLKHGHRSGILVDATFGTNEKKVSVRAHECYSTLHLTQFCTLTLIIYLSYSGFNSSLSTGSWCSTSGIMVL